jgi:hypothetical protein
MPIPPIQAYRNQQASLIPMPVGVYALCDLDEVPIYVGQSVDGIRARVRRHLTSARSDIIANRQVDVWEIAYVWAWPCADGAMITPLEGFLFHQFNVQSSLMNGTIPTNPGTLPFAMPERSRIQLVPDEEIAIRRDPSRRLPRQSQFYFQLVDHILNVKDNSELRRSLESHFERLSRYHQNFIGPALVVTPEDAAVTPEDG